MSDDWEDDGKAKNLSIPGMALPGLRDLRVQFVALIEWDLFLGPVVHINEISTGSSYIKKLRDYQTVSEVYAGVARADVDILTTPEDVIGVFRYDHENSSDVTGVLLISCIPDTDMDPIRTIGSRALIRSKADPEVIGQQLSLSLREFQSAARTFERTEGGVKIKIMAEGQILKPLEYKFIQGFSMVDLESNIADFRLFPRYLDGRDLDPLKILTYLDLQYDSIEPNMTTSLLYNNLPFILNRVGYRNVFFLTVVKQANLVQIMQMGDWLKISAESIENEWRFATEEEIRVMLDILEKSFSMSSPPEFIKNYLHTAMISNKLMPLSVNVDLTKLEKPEFIDDSLWRLVENFDGSHTIRKLTEQSGKETFEVIKFLEWGKYRNIIEYLR